MNYIYATTEFGIEMSAPRDEIPAIAEFRVTFLFPPLVDCGRIHLVSEPGLLGHLKASTNFPMAVGLAVSDFLSQRFKTFKMWQLYIHGRHYGPVVPPDAREAKVPIPHTPGLTYMDSANEEDTVNNVLYWDDMDAGFYRRFENAVSN